MNSSISRWLTLGMHVKVLHYVLCTVLKRFHNPSVDEFIQLLVPYLLSKDNVERGVSFIFHQRSLPVLSLGEVSTMGPPRKPGGSRDNGLFNFSCLSVSEFLAVFSMQRHE